MSLPKQILNRITEYTFDSVVSRIKPYKYISFDIFDTCVKRTVASPEEVFIVTAQKYNKQYENESIDATAFLKDRINAAREASKRNNVNEEITLEDIYNCLSEEYECKAERIKKIEIDCHIQVCRANPVIKQVYDWCKENEKIIIFSSDMFLDHLTIITILKECGYQEGYYKIYLSSEIGLKKSTGSLYKTVLSDLGIGPNEIIHIGDSRKADYQCAKQVGINSLLISQYPHREKYCKPYILNHDEVSTYKKMAVSMNGIIDPSWNEYFRYGFEVLGPLIFGFVVWLNERANEKEIDHLYFMARDGYLLKRAFEIINPNIQATYMEVSRRSLGFPITTGKSGLRTLVELNDKKKRWNCKMLCYRLGIDYKEGLNYWISSGLEENATIQGKEILGDKRVLDFYEKVQPIIDRFADEQSKFLMEYLQNVEFDSDSVVVDTGGNCTSQKYLNLFLNSNNISGYYLWKRKAADSLIAEAFPISEEDLDFGNMSIVEYFLTAHEGTTLYYTRSKNEVIAEHRDYEHDTASIEIINEVQAGILFFIKTYKFSYGESLMPANIYKNNIIAVSQKPSVMFSKMIGELTSYNDETIEKIAPSQGLLHYIVKPRDFFGDLKKAGWKTGYLKRTFRLPVNYNKVLRNMKKWMKK